LPQTTRSQTGKVNTALCCRKLLFYGVLYLDDIPVQKASFLALDSNKETSVVFIDFYFFVPLKIQNWVRVSLVGMLTFFFIFLFSFFLS